MNSRNITAIIVAISLVFCGVYSAHADESDIPTVQLPVKDSQLVTFRVQFRVGSIDDPSGKSGLTQLTTQMLTRGATKKHSVEEMTKLLYPMAAEIGARVDKEVTTVVGTTHVDNLDDYYQLFMEAILEPAFNESDYQRIKTNQMNYLSKTLRGSNDEEFGKQSLNAYMYSGHKYGAPIAGVVTDLGNITLDDVRNHYRKHFTRDNVTVGMSGGYSAGLLSRIKRDLSALPAGAPAVVELSIPEPIENVEVFVVEKECRATAVSMGFPIDITRGDADFYPLMIANSYLGEHRTFNGKLMIRMRQVRGLNYGDYSYIENFIQEGGSTFPVVNIPRRQQFFSIWIRPVQHEQRHYAIRLALWELEKLVRDGMSQEDFEATRQFLKNYSKLWAQNQSRRLGFLMDSRYYGTGDFLKTLSERLDAVTLDDVNAAIRRHLNFENIKIAVITKGADEFLSDLISNKPSPISYDSDGMSAEVLAEDKLVAAYKLKINRADSRVVSADEMFE